MAFERSERGMGGAVLNEDPFSDDAAVVDSESESATMASLAALLVLLLIKLLAQEANPMAVTAFCKCVTSAPILLAPGPKLWLGAAVRPLVNCSCCCTTTLVIRARSVDKLASLKNAMDAHRTWE